MNNNRALILTGILLIIFAVLVAKLFTISNKARGSLQAIMTSICQTYLRISSWAISDALVKMGSTSILSAGNSTTFSIYSRSASTIALSSSSSSYKKGIKSFQTLVRPSAFEMVFRCLIEFSFYSTLSLTSCSIINAISILI